MKTIFNLNIQGGDDPTPNVLNFGLLFLVRNRDVLERVQMEIDSNLGSRSPRMDDREKLPFTQANKIVPLGLHQKLRSGKMWELFSLSFSCSYVLPFVLYQHFEDSL